MIAEAIGEIRSLVESLELAVIDLELEHEEQERDAEVPLFGNREEEIERLRAENLSLREHLRRQAAEIHELKRKRGRGARTINGQAALLLQDAGGGAHV